MMASCEVEFSPNAEWKNIPVVYCILDQDDDTSWVRLERCYLSSDGAFTHGRDADSINYPEGAVSVAILAYENGALKDSLPFQYTLRPRDTGTFASEPQPLYYCFTRNRLKFNYQYILKVRNGDGSLLLSTDPVRLISNPENELLFTNPDNMRNRFAFYSSEAQGSPAENCAICWRTLENARSYQPMVRFYYQVHSETRHVDLFCRKVNVKSTNTTSCTTYYQRRVFLDDLKEKLKSDTASHKKYIPRVDIYLTSCTEDINAYMNSVDMGNHVTDGDYQLYTNVHGGLGIFGARRTHLYRSMDADTSLVDKKGLFWFLINELGME